MLAIVLSSKLIKEENFGLSNSLQLVGSIGRLIQAVELLLDTVSSFKNLK